MNLNLDASNDEGYHFRLTTWNEPGEKGTYQCAQAVVSRRPEMTNWALGSAREWVEYKTLGIASRERAGQALVDAERKAIRAARISAMAALIVRGIY